MEDLIDILEDYLSPVEIVKLLSNILKCKYNSEEKLKEYAIYNNICPRCYSELTMYTWKESRGEHFGFPAEEEMSELRCNDCGWNNNKY